MPWVCSTWSGYRPRYSISNMRGLFCFLLLFTAQALAERPNVLLVYVDDLGYGDTAVYGHPVVETPNIDQLAADGVRFTQFYAASALCSPSRAGLLTGRTPYRTGIRSWIPDNSEVALDRDEVTIAQWLKPLGYRTAVIGKWHLNGGLDLDDTPQPRDFGFDYQYGLAAWVKNEKAAQAGEGRLFPDNMFRNNVAVGETSKFSAELVSDEAIAWLGQSSEPFFLFLTYSEVHAPIASPLRLVRQYDQYLTEEARLNPWSYYMDWADRPYRGKGEYYANITFLDEQLGRVLAHLQQAGLSDNTLVMFSSDNGPLTTQVEMPWEIGLAGETNGLRGKKRFLHEGGIRVPGIFSWPGRIPAGQVVTQPATVLDVLPTLADILDVPLPADRIIDGASITALLDDDPGTAVRRQRPFYWSIPTPDGLEYAVRDGDWKMLLSPAGEPVSLYNLQADRYEINDRLEAEPLIATRMKRAFDAYRASVEGDAD